MSLAEELIDQIVNEAEKVKVPSRIVTMVNRAIRKAEKKGWKSDVGQLTKLANRLKKGGSKEQITKAAQGPSIRGRGLLGDEFTDYIDVDMDIDNP